MLMLRNLTDPHVVAECAEDINWLASMGYCEIDVHLGPGIHTGIVAPAATLRGTCDGELRQCDFRGANLELAGKGSIAADCDITCAELSGTVAVER